MNTYLFTFEMSHDARRFVKRLAHVMNDVAVLIDGIHVRVLDGAKSIDRRESIYQLAVSSSGGHVEADFPSPSEPSLTSG